MNDYFIKYKPFLLFLGKFFLTYLVLTAVYQTYLSQFDEEKLEVDQLTESVAHQTKFLLVAFNSDAAVVKHESQPCFKLFFGKKYVARIIEGCNAISVMILFVSFVVAFAGRWKSMIVFILLGCILIHILNIARIALLAAAIFHFPQYEQFLHGVLFPLFIYGVVFTLWVIWVNKYSSYAKKPIAP